MPANQFYNFLLGYYLASLFGVYRLNVKVNKDLFRVKIETRLLLFKTFLAPCKLELFQTDSQRTEPCTREEELIFRGCNGLHEM
jgi:hypothetical protein